MVTLTTSGLSKPDYADPASILPINANSVLIDKYGMGAYVILDDTFPANPWEGMKVYKSLYQELYTWSTFNGAHAGQWYLIGASRKIAYTPLTSGITLGTGGSIAGEYFRVAHNGLVNAVSIHYRMHLALGTGGLATATLAVGLPGVPEAWAAAGTDLMKVVGHALASSSASPSSGATAPGILIPNAVTAVGSGGETQQMCNITPDTTLSGSLWNATIPFTWANASNMWVQGHYWPDQNGTSWGV